MQPQQRLDPLNGRSDGRRADRLHGSAAGLRVEVFVQARASSSPLWYGGAWKLKIVREGSVTCADHVVAVVGQLVQQAGVGDQGLTG